MFAMAWEQKHSKSATAYAQSHLQHINIATAYLILPTRIMEARLTLQRKAWQGQCLSISSLNIAIRRARQDRHPDRASTITSHRHGYILKSHLVWWTAQPTLSRIARPDGRFSFLGMSSPTHYHLHRETRSSGQRPQRRLRVGVLQVFSSNALTTIAARTNTSSATWRLATCSQN